MALKKTEANAVIYVWSPRMALSVFYADEVARQAQAASLTFIPVVDARVPAQEWLSSLGVLDSGVSGSSSFYTLQASHTLCTEQLIALDAYQHLPSVFMVLSGELQTKKWTGAMPASSWARAFKTDLLRSNLLKRTSLVTSAQGVIAPATHASLPSYNLARSSTQSESGCIAANQFIVLPPELAGLGDDQAVALGAYERISPDGRFILRSYSGKNLSTVSLMELPGPALQPLQPDANVVAVTQTPLANEAFPVQGSWRYIVNTNGQHYTFKDLLTRQKQATPHFQGGMSGFYAAAAEVASKYPETSSDPIQIRSLSWPNAVGDSETAGEGMLTARTITVNSQQNRLLADSGRANLCLGRISTDGSLYSLPMISVDGQYFAALPQRPVDGVANMRVFGFGDGGKQCIPAQNFTSSSGKVTFGFAPGTAKPGAPGLADLVYEYRGQAWWYSSQESKAISLAPWQERPTDDQTAYRQKILASAFPGLTRDGRVIYAATWQSCVAAKCKEQAGYVVSDPYQSNAYQEHVLAQNTQNASTKKAPVCIKTSDVLRERANFAKFHGIPLR